jgi:hypothetical protein
MKTFEIEGPWQVAADRIEKYATDPKYDEAIVRVALLASEVAYCGVRRDGSARWFFIRGTLTIGEHISLGEIERVVHEAAKWLWDTERRLASEGPTSPKDPETSL